MKPSSWPFQLINRFCAGRLAAPLWLNGLAAVLLVVGLLANPARGVAEQAAAPTRVVVVLGQHLVQKGDTLFCLGRAYGVLPAAIAEANSLRWPYRLLPGQVLLIPAAPWGSIPPGPVCAAQFTSPFPGLAAVAPTARPPNSPAPQVPIPAAISAIGRHVVRAGETLFCIGRGYRVPPLAIAAANGLRPPYRLSPGQILVIPAEQWNAVPSGPVCAPQWTPTPLTLLPAPTPTTAPREKSQPDNPPPATLPPTTRPPTTLPPTTLPPTTLPPTTLPPTTPPPTTPPIDVFPSKTPIPTRTPGPTKTPLSAP